MRQFQRCVFYGLLVVWTCWSTGLSGAPDARLDGNRLTYLDEDNPFYPHLGFARLATQQWVGDPGVEAVVILAIDDMSQPAKYETVLRPILNRLKQIDGRAPVSIMCNRIDPAHAQQQQWLTAGVSLEVHTLAHPCPFLAKSNFVAAADTYHLCVDLLNRVPGSKPVAFRMPCCDSINSPSPRFYAEIFNQTNAAGQFLTIDSSVMNVLTKNDTTLPRELVTDAGGGEKFRKYLPFPSFVTTIDDYPYPYVIGKLCWEFPAMAPSDWEAQHIHGTNNPVTVADWKAALDATVLKQGTFTFIFHPHGWIRPDQMVEFINYAAERYGPKVKFLNFAEAEARLNKHLLGGQPLRAANGQDNGVRLLDLNHDGYLDVVIGNSAVKKTRVWSPGESAWKETSFPTAIVATDPGGVSVDAGLRFGILEADGRASVLVNGATKGVWHFDGQQWVERRGRLSGLELEGQPVLTQQNNRDRGVRLRDLDQDGRCECIVGNDTQNAVFGWSEEEETWTKLAYGLPRGASIVNRSGQDNGLRFVDVNEDGFDDVVFSNESRYSLHLFVPQHFLGFAPGWSREVLTGDRGQPGDIPMIVRSGPARNNGAWFHSRQLWVQNEDTSGMPDYVDRRSFGELLGGLQPKPKSPEEALASMRVRPGFRVEQVAAEPLVKDPIAFEWGPDGKIWVVEMGDYPLGIDGQGRSGGVVRYLQDTDGDGRYDRSTVFLDGVNFPTGVMPWGNGVVVSAAPEIFYAEDRDGDGKADLRITLFDGFVEGNQQHRLNGFDYGLDNWLYGANGDSGGHVRAVGVPPGRNASTLSQTVFELRGHDFRLRPDQALFETVSGQTQFGRHRDDWGNWFGNNNPAWLWHVFLPEQYLARNPHLPVKSVKQYLANYPDSTRVYPASRSMQRFNDIGMLGHVTSANSPTPYRDELFGPDYSSSVFISEPVHNVIHREVLQPDGITFTSRRAADEQDREFLASTDNWFRPTMLKTGPDGALYIADMYRLVLEHPEWIPADSQKHLDLRAGQDKGRIYRVVPEGATSRATPRLAGLTPDALADRMDSPNGWTRDTVQRLIVQAGDAAVAPKLVRLASDSPNPKVRVQALATLDGLGALSVASLTRALADSHPAVREHAVRLSEVFAKASGQGMIPARERAALEEQLLGRIRDESVRVRYQLAFTLGEWPDAAAGQGLVQLHAEAADQPHLLTAVLSSAAPHVRVMIDTILREYRERPPVTLFQQLLSLAVARKENGSLVRALPQIGDRRGDRYQVWQFAAAAGFLDGVERDHQSLASFERRAEPEMRTALNGLVPLFKAARAVAQDGTAMEPERVAAIRLLGRGAEPKEDLLTLTELLRPQLASQVRAAALNTLKRLEDPDIAALLLKGWRSYEPNMRTDVLGALLSRSEWTGELLAELEAGAVSSAQISPADQQKMFGSANASIRTRAEKLFGITSNRRQIIQEYHDVLELTGDGRSGAGQFRQNCATCHRLREEGVNVGPDLGALANKSTQSLLVAILAPSQAVEARYVNYTALTRSERELSGILVAETPSSVTLRSAGGTEETVLRSDLQDLSSSGLSLMPEGFEKVMSKQQLADLIAFLTGHD